MDVDHLCCDELFTVLYKLSMLFITIIAMGVTQIFEIFFFYITCVTIFLPV